MCQKDLKFQYCLLDSWYANVENFKAIRQHKKHFVASLKSNRLVKLKRSEESRENGSPGQFTPIDQLTFPDNTPILGWLKGYDSLVLFTRQYFTNQDGSIAVIDLVSSDITCDHDSLAITYQKRWNVEVFHKSLKSNAALAKSPAHTIRTQANHLFMAIYATFKLTCLSLSLKTNPFGLSRKLCIAAARAAYSELTPLRSSTTTA